MPTKATVRMLPTIPYFLSADRTSLYSLPYAPKRVDSVAIDVRILRKTDKFCKDEAPPPNPDPPMFEKLFAMEIMNDKRFYQY
jgi:hypothetical protein